MEPILFYGDHAASSFGTIVALEWLGQPYRLHRLELPRATKTAFYARINPVQKVPALLLEDGSTLSESIAILPHLAARDPDRRSSYEQWDLPLTEALANETALGLETLASGESREGAARFAAGAGRGGEF